ADLAAWCRTSGPLAVGPARDVLAFLTGDMEIRRRVLKRVWVPVLFAGREGHDGILARLWVEVIQNGTGQLYPDPVYFDPAPMSASFLRTPAVARRRSACLPVG